MSSIGKTVDQKEARHFASRYNAEFMLCRDLRHAWDEGASSKFIVSVGFVGRHLTCMRCGTERVDVYGKNSMALEGRRYNYPDGYQRQKDDPKLAGDLIRATNFKRAGSRDMPSSVADSLKRWR